MPFMIGKEPVRRTIKYLSAGKLMLKNSIQIFSMHYNVRGDNNKGMREFVFWHLPQLLYKNPNVQILTIKNMTPSPYVWCFYENGNKMLIDCDMKSKDEIMEHLLKVVGKSKDVLRKETVAQEKIDNPANFGVGYEKNCICIIPGQLPCPAVVPLPNHMRGKFKYAKEE